MKSSSVQKSLAPTNNFCIQRTAICNNKKGFGGFPLQHLDYCHLIP